MTSHVYFIQDVRTSDIKIGISKDPLKRLAALQTAHAHDLVLLAATPGADREERALHLQFSCCRKRGEWFAATDELMALIAQQPKFERPVRKTEMFWNGVSAAEVSRRTGLSRRLLCEIQAGKHRPSPEKAILIQRATGKSAIALIFGDLASEAA